MKKIVLGLSGASGSVYGIRLLEILLHLGHEVHTVCSRIGKSVTAYELGIADNTDRSGFFDTAISLIREKYQFNYVVAADLKKTSSQLSRQSETQTQKSREHTKNNLTHQLELSSHGNKHSGTEDLRSRLILHEPDDFFAVIASGSFQTAGMVIAPCSMNTLSCISNGINLHLMHRAAEVHLKEKRKLVLLTRETPLSVIHLENMLSVTRAGAVVVPASPHFYAPKAEDVRITSGDLIDSVISKVLDQLSVEHNMPYRYGVA